MRSNSQSDHVTVKAEKKNDMGSLVKPQDFSSQLIAPKMQSAEKKKKKSQFLNGRAKTTPKVDHETYYSYKEELPQNFHPLLQYLDVTELKFANDNLYNNSPHGFPTRAFVLRSKSSHLPVIKDTLAERARYKRKLEEKNKNIALSCKKFEFKTYDGSSSHYFITGARYNRYDTVDSKILNTYGIFIKRDNPELVYFKSGSKPDFFQDLSNNSAITNYDMVEKAGRKNNLYDVSSEYDVEVTKDNALKFTNSHKVYKNQAVQAQPEKLRLNKLAITQE